MTNRWVTCQIGARERYAIPRALLACGALDRLLTEAWGPKSRFHAELDDAPITAFNSTAVIFEAIARARRLRGWNKILARNEWFQAKVVNYLSSYQLLVTGDQVVVFAYSYAAKEIFRFAKERGWRTVLGQIDPGPAEEEIVADEVARHPELAGEWQRAPKSYWENWRDECELADAIIVNSSWSRTCLEKAGVISDKLSVMPLAYEEPIRETQITRRYPDAFTAARPLRVLFLGQINLRKGVARLFGAVRMLRDEPVEFWMAGPVQINILDDMANHPRIRWIGRVDRARAGELYRTADVFILPTLSDGFALTQLEAQAHGLPVIVSKRCGEVVQNGVNGLVLEEPTSECIASAVESCLRNPEQVAGMAVASRVDQRFSLAALGENLHSIAQAF